MISGKTNKKKVPFYIIQKASMVTSVLSGLTLKEAEAVLKQAKKEIKSIMQEPRF